MSGRLCRWLTAAEVDAVIGVGNLDVREERGDSTAGYCSYVAGDRVVASTSYLVSGAMAAFDAYGSDGKAVKGLGDAAIWVERLHTLFIRRGDSLMGIQLLDTIIGDDAIEAATISLGKKAAGRLP